MKRTPTKGTLFYTVFGIEEVLPIELKIPNFRVQTFNKMINEVGMRAQLDGMEEVHETA